MNRDTKGFASSVVLPSDHAIIALGSNLPGGYISSVALIEGAISTLERSGSAVLARSSFWRSAAWPEPADPPFVNAIVIAKVTLPPLQLLRSLLAIEAHFGRRRPVLHAPRTLDLDLVAYGERIVSNVTLTLPHPRAHERGFVMGPLAELAPRWRHPVLGREAWDLAASASVGQDAAPFASAR